MTLLRGLTFLLNSVASLLTALEVDIVVFVSVWDIFPGILCISFDVCFIVSILHSFHMGRVCKIILTKELYTIKSDDKLKLGQH